MAEILKITTPVQGKNQVQPNKPVVDPSVPFNLPETERVVKTTPQSSLLQQNNGMIQKDESPNILLNLLKDPSVTVNFLKNISMLEEIIMLLPVNNKTMTREIEQLFDTLLVQPEDIAQEMMNQANKSTVFKGDLFDFLRELSSRSGSPELKRGIANLLKAINAKLGQQDVLESVGNNLQFLSDSLQASKQLSSHLAELAREFFSPKAPQQFEELKERVFVVLDDVENSILLSPKMKKVVSMLVYNLSRFNSNPDFLQDALTNLVRLVDGRAQKDRLIQLCRELIQNTGSWEDRGERSKIMDLLVKILGDQAKNEELTLLNSDKVEKIIHSLLSSPSNFTPLLHFVVPAEYMGIRAFAEFWINPDGKGDIRPAPPDLKDGIHMLIVFDIEGIGQFETELYVAGEEITLTLLCPPAYEQHFRGVPGDFQSCIAGLGYRFKNITVGKLERPHSLMDVFRSLPYKRTGVDVKI